MEKKRILISPYSSAIPMVKDRKTDRNAKNFPYWKELVKKLNDLGFEVLQIGVSGEKQIPGTSKHLLNAPIPELVKMINVCDFVICVDNFFHHMCHFYKKSPVFVLWGPSDPKIFGYPENINILKSRECLRPYQDQFLFWRWEEYKIERFPSAEAVMKVIKKYVKFD